MRKRMIFIPAGVILFILFFTIFGERGVLHIQHLKTDREEIQKQLDLLKVENDKLRREIEALKTDRRYLESIARRDFGLVRPNEIVYQFPKVERTNPAEEQPSPPPVDPKKPAAVKGRN